MHPIAYLLLALPIALAGYAYAGYPLALMVLARFRPDRAPPVDATDWPFVTVTIAAYNEEATIGRTLENLLTADYPRDRLHVVVISDCSSDRTDEIVRGFADRGVELVRLPRRSGKTAAENASRGHIRGTVVVNTDASVLIARDALKPLVAAFQDPSVGVASGRDVSVGPDGHANRGEGRYVSYEMQVRALETRVDGIVGASGCFFASRPELHEQIVPEALSRDFAAPLIARERGFRSVSVNDAVCYVPRTASLQQEYRRKVRTMTRGLETLWYKRRLLNPFRYGIFAWMLWSHKLARWVTPCAGVLALLALSAAALWAPWARFALAATVVGSGLGAVGWVSQRRDPPLFLALPSYVVVGLAAGVHAWCGALAGEMNPVWEPTRRDTPVPNDAESARRV